MCTVLFFFCYCFVFPYLFGYHSVFFTLHYDVIARKIVAYFLSLSFLFWILVFGMPRARFSLRLHCCSTVVVFFFPLFFVCDIYSQARARQLPSCSVAHAIDAHTKTNLNHFSWLKSNDALRYFCGVHNYYPISIIYSSSVAAIFFFDRY